MKFGIKISKEQISLNLDIHTDKLVSIIMYTCYRNLHVRFKIDVQIITTLNNQLNKMITDIHTNKHTLKVEVR